MAKVKELGVVKVIHESGMRETDSGVTTLLKAKVGERIIKDEDGKIKVAPKKTKTITVEKVEYETLDQFALAEKYKLEELKAICKQEKITNYSKLNEAELCEKIALHLETFKTDDGE